MKPAWIALSFLALPALAEDLAAPESFAAIEDEAERAAAIFTEMGKVLQHPRCLNCHPVDGTPRQGDDLALHQPPVVRGGESGFGAPGMRCTTCHGAENVEYVGAEGSVPGHQPWHLAPLSMGWIGLTLPEICAQIKDPERNGGKSLAELQDHNANDGLVGWGWAPGEGREPAPGSQERFGALTQAWIDAGAGCPSG
ncbi:Isoquinoline 1-oxidoreductase subunit [Roseovarius sp. S1116L3]|uniref:Isoquinoline 1-oxidoreductase subunit n=1 Tax=Roseovarius roseus TaxID=3342636 RepID=UPI003729922F